MSEDKIAWTLELIKKLQYWKIGDFSRLDAIKNVLENGRTVYESDKKYLKEKFEELKKFESGQQSETKNEIKSETEPEKIVAESESDESLKILKNRLANGEITLDEFNALKTALMNVDSVKELKNQVNSMTKHMEKISQEQKENLLIQTRGKSESTTLILSLVLGLFGLQGIGHMYVDKWGKGIAILIISLILFWAGIATFPGGAILLVIYFIVFIWQIFDARNVCRDYNMLLTPSGQKIQQRILEHQSAFEFYHNKKYQKCLEICDNILKEHPYDMEALTYKAFALDKLQQYSEAKNLYEFILEKTPDDKEIKKHLKRINKKISE